MSKKYMGVAVLALMMMLPAAALAARPGPPVGDPSIGVMGHAELGFKPDQAVLYIEVISQESGAKQAAQTNAELSGEVLAALKKIKSSADKLESAGYSLGAVKEYDRVRSVNILKGYRAVHTLKFTSSDLDSMGAVIDTAVAAGARGITGPRWGLADPATARIKAKQAALLDAKAQAAALADTAGMKLGVLLRADAAPGSGGMAPMRAAVAERSAGTKLEPGSVVVNADVRCVYSLVPQK